jgi:predicted MFS family arabinose efflux permease
MIRLKDILRHRDLRLFLIASACLGIATGIDSSFFNNYLSDMFRITVSQRTLLEIPREFPGFMVVFVSGLLISRGSVRTAAIANVLASLGSLGLGLFSPQFSIMVAWMTVYSLGQHLYMPMSSSVSMSLAREGQIGKVLGMVNAYNTAAYLVTAIAVAGVTQLTKLPYEAAFALSSISYLGAALSIFMMTPQRPAKSKKAIVLKREYSLFYILSILFGARKQIFITFGPWVLIKVFNQGVSTFAIISFLTAFTGIFFKPFVGSLIDRMGERFVLIGEAILLVVVCFGYAIAEFAFGKGQFALVVIGACYVADQLLASCSMARSVYVKKIAHHEDDISPTLAMGTTIDHIASMAIPALGNIVWITYGYQYVFVVGMAVAFLNIAFARQMKPHIAYATT